MLSLNGNFFSKLNLRYLKFSKLLKLLFSTKKRLYFDVKKFFAGKNYFKVVKTATKHKNAILLTCYTFGVLLPLGVKQIFSLSEFSQKSSLDPLLKLATYVWYPKPDL